MKTYKPFLPIILLISYIFFLPACFFPRTVVPEEPVQTATPVSAELVVLHWNDFHSANLPYQPFSDQKGGDWVGGYATLAGYLDSLKNVNPDAVTLHAGDDFQGSPVSTVTKGMSQILILNKIQPTAFEIGNHEFDYGVENVKAAMRKADFPMISSNIYDSTQSALLLKPYVIRRAGDVRIGIIGAVGADLFSSVLRENVQKLSILDPVQEIRRNVALLRDSCDILVVLTHAGFREDSLLATELQEVDVIIGGHSHTTVRQPLRVNDILVCQAGSRGRYLGKLVARVNLAENKIDSYQYDLLTMDVSGIKPDAGVKVLVDSLEQTIETEMDRKIGDLQTAWRRNGHGESNIGNWLCDALRDYFQVDIAFHNSGGIRKDLGRGPIIVRDLWEIIPFDNTTMLVKVSGEQLLRLMQWRLDNPRDFLQVSGIRYQYNSSNNELVSVEVGGQEIRPEKEYSFAANNYIISYFQRFFGLGEKEVKIVSTPVLVRDVLIEAVEKQGIIGDSLDGRIVDIAE